MTLKRSPMARSRSKRMPPTRKATTRREHLALYLDVSRPERMAAHPVCERCGVAPSVLTHHVAGRLGALLSDVENLRALCSPCHDAIHATPSASYEQGWMVRRHSVAAPSSPGGEG